MLFIKKSTLFGIVTAAATLFAVDYDHNFRLVSELSNATNSNAKEIGYHLDYNGEVSFTNTFTMPLEIQANHYSGSGEADDKSPIRNQTYPVTYLLTGGLKYHDAVTIRANGFTRIPINNNEAGLPFSLSEDTLYKYGYIKELYRIGSFFAFNTEESPIDIQAYANYQIRNFNFGNSAVDSLGKSGEFDSDLWMRGSVGKLIKEKVDVELKYFGKSELSNVSKDFDWHQLYLGVASDIQPVRKKLYLWGDFYGTYTASENMVNHGYLAADKLNMGINSHWRALFKLKSKLFLKGDLLVDVNSLMQKFRYELAMRNVFDKNGATAIQAGFWTTPGALISRHCGYIHSSIALSDKLSLIPEARGYWKWDDASGDEGFNYYRSDFSMNLSVRLPRDKKIFKSTRLYGGALYKMYQDEDFYPSSLNLYAGVKTYL